MRHPTRKLLISLGVFVACLLLIEGAVRIRSILRYGSSGPLHTFVLDKESGLMIPAPGRTTKHMSLDSRGFRNPELEVPKPEGRLRIAFLGGSTTFCAEATSNEATWPHLVWQCLAERFPEASIDYVNAGVGGYPLEHTERNLIHRVAPLEPDMIVIYEATNDLSQNSRALARSRGVYTGHADAKSWLASVSLAWYLVEKNVLVKRRMRAGAQQEARLSYEPAELTEPFREDLLRLVERAQEVCDLVVLVTFSHQVREEMSPEERLLACNTSLYYMPYMTPEGILTGFRAYNQVIADVGAAEGALVIGGEEEIPGDQEHFQDSVHFTDVGCRAMARRICARLVQDERVARTFEPR
jgi:hypothetical protein